MFKKGEKKWFWHNYFNQALLRRIWLFRHDFRKAELGPVFSVGMSDSYISAETILRSFFTAARLADRHFRLMPRMPNICQIYKA